jgi:site-specific recombinase XerD
VIAAVDTLPFLIQQFFLQYLPVERNLSPNTILSYRDALKLLLRFISDLEGRSPDELTCEDLLDPERVRAFLRWLAEKRRCGAKTRNLRLSALRTFAHYVALRAPEYLERCRKIREIPRARVESLPVEYLEGEEMGGFVAAIDPASAAGLRDRALVLLLYNTGARVQEVVDLDVGHLRLDEVPCVRLFGKGRKGRTSPLWAKTVSALRGWIATRNRPASDAPLFLNSRGQRLTRSGVAYVLKRTALRAGLERPKHARQITPHVIRHTTAMHMLQAGVDLTAIASCLGHAQLSTTHCYVEVDLRMKQEALAAANAIPELREGAYPSEDVITWLEQLGRRPRYVEPDAADRRATGPPACCST